MFLGSSARDEQMVLEKVDRNGMKPPYGSFSLSIQKDERMIFYLVRLLINLNDGLILSRFSQ